MPRFRVPLLTLLAMLAFAANSLLCRAALQHSTIDPATFTLVRLVAGALVLWGIVRWRGGRADRTAGNWPSSLALFAYAAAFSLAYVSLPAASGALLLFGAVQATILGAGLWRGERFGVRQSLGLTGALAGLIGLLLPGLSAPPLGGALLMLAAGVAWGVYSLRGRGGSGNGNGSGNALAVTAGNFLRAVVFAALLSGLLWSQASLDAAGFGWAVASGALASGLGYAVWYSVLPTLRVSTAATVQLSVPVITAAGGVLLLGEPLSWRLVLASLAILGGIGLVIVAPGRRA